MTVLSAKFRRDLLLSRGMLAAVIAIITAGTGCFYGMLSVYDNLENARSDYYSQCRMADFWIELKKVPLSKAKELLTIPGISEIRERISFPVIVDLPATVRPVSGHLLTLPGPHDSQSVINGMVLTRGSYFSPDRRHEVIISEKFARARNIAPGSYIYLVLNGQRKKLSVVGTATSSEYMYLTPPGSIACHPADYGIFYIQREYAEEVFDFAGACNNIVGLLTPEARRQSEPILAEIARRLSSYGVFLAIDRGQQFSHMALSSELQGLKSMAVVLPLIFLGVAALVLNILMIRLTEQQRTVIGTLKALGYTDRQLSRHFLQYGLFVGTIGGVAGCALGYFVAGAMTDLYRTLFEFPNLTNAVYPGILGMTLAVSISCAVAGAWRGSKAVMRLTAAEAMRDRMPALGGAIFLERWTSLWSRLDFRWQIVLRSLLRNKVRSLVSGFAAAMGSALMLLALGMNDSLIDMLVFQFDKVLRCDYQITLKDGPGASAIDEVRRLPGVTEVEPIFSVPCTFYRGTRSKKGVISGLTPQASMTIPRDASGQPVAVPRHGLMMTDRLAEYFGVKEGDTVRFVPVKGSRVVHEVPVLKIVSTVFGLSVYADYHYLSHMLGEAGAVSQLQIRAHQTPSQQEAFYRYLKDCPALESLAETGVEKESLQNEFIAKLKGVSLTMILFAAVIFFGSILNGSLISISERRREIATFRVMGYHPREAGIIFLRENMLVNTMGALIGLPLGYFLLHMLMLEYRTDAYAIPTKVYPMTWVLTIVLSVLFVLCAHIVIHRSISRMEWSGALKMKE